MDWGNFETPEGRAAITQSTLQYLNDARAFGVTKAVVGISYLVYGTETQKDDLRAFFVEIQTAGFLNMVAAVYPIHEPDTVHGRSAEQIAETNGALRSVTADFYA